MLNEFVYCPRLFYLEWVDHRWADNDDTIEGSVAHDATDRRSGRMPEPDEETQPPTSIQVALSDHELGLTAVIDRVDHADGTSSPVDMKKGHGPDDGGMWPADRAQVLAQAVLLRRAGYRVNQAQISYLGSHHRATVEVTADAETEIRELISQARQISESETPPPPLLNDRRCPRCSLAPLCLPDETNYLLNRSDTPKRIIARDPDARPVYVSAQGSKVKVSGKRLIISTRGETVSERRLVDVSQVCVVGNVQVTTQAMRALWRQGTNIVWLSYGGWFEGWSQAPSKQAMIRGKIHNQRVLLRRNAKTELPPDLVEQLKGLEKKATTAEAIPQLLGIEGTAARIYFSQFHTMFAPRLSYGEEFQAYGRQRRPPPDPVNTVLGFTYSLLVKDLVSILVSVGLDPYLGVLHQARYGRPALALDLSEEFRGLIAESVTIQCFNNGELGEKDFIRHTLGVRLTADGRKKVIRAYERRLETKLQHPIFQYTVSYRRALNLQARILAAAFTNELDAYTPLMTR
ncbi:MAG: CRISPR-associated protein Cas1 [Propionibacterium sp.]|nr:MAG: CRISPR-associated protein Cas1 [Propionibacterium sp.]